jgi:hypothetical protein
VIVEEGIANTQMVLEGSDNLGLRMIVEVVDTST